MTTLCLRILAFTLLAGRLGAQEILFQDDFKGKVGEGWSWVREHREAWRVSDRGLEVRIEPGNMWGPANNARNLLVRAVPEVASNTVEVAVSIENRPSNQYEQVDLVWYYDDSNMVKLGQELVDGKLSVVMGREEQDRCRTIAIVPLDSASVRVKLTVNNNAIRGQFRTPGGNEWRDVGQTTFPTPGNATAKVSLQFYQGSEKAEHWARVTEFRVLKP